MVPSTFITHSHQIKKQHQITIKNNNITGVKKSLTDNMRNPINVRAVHDYHHIESSDTYWDPLQQNADLRTTFRNNSIELQGLKACWSSRLWLQRVFTEHHHLFLRCLFIEHHLFLLYLFIEQQHLFLSYCIYLLNNTISSYCIYLLNHTSSYCVYLLNNTTSSYCIYLLNNPSLPTVFIY